MAPFREHEHQRDDDDRDGERIAHQREQRPLARRCRWRELGIDLSVHPGVERDPGDDGDSEDHQDGDGRAGHPRPELAFEEIHEVEKPQAVQADENDDGDNDEADDLEHHRHDGIDLALQFGRPAPQRFGERHPIAHDPLDDVEDDEAGQNDDADLGIGPQIGLELSARSGQRDDGEDRDIDEREDVPVPDRQAQPSARFPVLDHAHELVAHGLPCNEDGGGGQEQRQEQQDDRHGPSGRERYCGDQKRQNHHLSEREKAHQQPRPAHDRPRFAVRKMDEPLIGQVGRDDRAQYRKDHLDHQERVEIERMGKADFTRLAQKADGNHISDRVGDRSGQQVEQQFQDQRHRLCDPASLAVERLEPSARPHDEPAQHDQPAICNGRQNRHIGENCPERVELGDVEPGEYPGRIGQLPPQPGHRTRNVLDGAAGEIGDLPSD